jgi:hypothetical protein
MPIHDWSRKPVGLFHHFHQRWAVSICDALNAGRLPDGFYALLEQHAAGVIPVSRPCQPETSITTLWCRPSQPTAGRSPTIHSG